MTPINYAFWNDGRRKHGDTTKLDLVALQTLKDALPKTRTAVFLTEINEGDDNNELAAAREVFDGWQVHAGPHGRRVREPILLSPDFADARSSVIWIPNTAVKHWSPQRSLLTVHLPDEPVSLLAIHYPAGPFTPAPRPNWAEDDLLHSWRMCHQTHVRHQRALHNEGRNIVWMMDVNNRNFVHIPGEQTVVNHWTDWGRVYPAAGYGTQFKALPPVDLHVDEHDGQRMRGRFTLS